MSWALLHHTGTDTMVCDFLLFFFLTWMKTSLLLHKAQLCLLKFIIHMKDVIESQKLEGTHKDSMSRIQCAGFYFAVFSMKQKMFWKVSPCPGEQKEKGNKPHAETLSLMFNILAGIIPFGHSNLAI